MEPDDLEFLLDLIRRARTRDREAQEALLARYDERVRRIVRLRMGSELRGRLDEVEGLVREVCRAAIEAFDNFSPRDEASFIEWLARIAEAQLRAGPQPPREPQIGAEGFRPAEFRIKSGPAGVNLVATGLAPDKDAASGELIANGGRDAAGDPAVDPERTARVEAALAKLPPEWRELIILRNYAGFSWEDIARQTGRPSAAAARMMHAKALIELARRMRGE